MRTITAGLETAQQRNNRLPISRVEVYDTLLRWSAINTSFCSDAVWGDEWVNVWVMDMDVHANSDPRVNFVWMVDNKPST